LTPYRGIDPTTFADVLFVVPEGEPKRIRNSRADEPALG
jgi:hypothetical protein